MKSLLILLLLFFIGTASAQMSRHKLGFYELVSLGQIVGAKSVFKFGYNEDVSIGTPEDCIGAGGDMFWISSASTLTIVSASTSDDTGGTGAITVSIDGLDSNYDEISETVTMDGTVAVTTSLSYLRINRVIVLTSGSNGNNVGILSLKQSTNVVAIVSANEGQSTLGVYTVPRNSKFLIYSFLSGVTKKASTGGNAHFEVRPFGGSWNIKQLIALEANSFERDTVLPFYIPEKSDIRIRFEDILANNTGVTCAFDGILLNNSTFQGI